MKNIFKTIGLARFSRSLPLADRQGRDVAGSWQEDFLLGSSDTDAHWYYERRRWRDQG